MNEVISVQSLNLIEQFIRDKKIEYFYQTQMIHEESDLDKIINKKSHPFLEMKFAEFMKKYKFSRQSPTGYYVLASLLDRSTLLK